MRGSTAGSGRYEDAASGRHRPGKWLAPLPPRPRPPPPPLPPPPPPRRQAGSGQVSIMCVAVRLAVCATGAYIISARKRCESQGAPAERLRGASAHRPRCGQRPNQHRRMPSPPALPAGRGRWPDARAPPPAPPPGARAAPPRPRPPLRAPLAIARSRSEPSGEAKASKGEGLEARPHRLALPSLFHQSRSFAAFVGRLRGDFAFLKLIERLLALKRRGRPRPPSRAVMNVARSHAKPLPAYVGYPNSQKFRLRSP